MTRILDTLIDDANRKLEMLAVSMDRSLETTGILFYPAPRTILKERHLEYHVHLAIGFGCGTCFWLNRAHCKQRVISRGGGGSVS